MLSLSLIFQLKTKGVQFKVYPYHYWYTLHHGLKRRGRLRRAFPPYYVGSELYKWVTQVLRPSIRRERFGKAKAGKSQQKQFERSAKAVAFTIHRKGIAPNTYIPDTYEENADKIRETAGKIGQDILLDTFRLPNIG